jgi:hypothetical protein
MVAPIYSARSERIARTAGHPARQVRLTRDHLGRRRPVSTPLDVVHAAPLEAIAVDANAIS